MTEKKPEEKDDDAQPEKAKEKLWPTYEPNPLYDYRTGKLYKRNSRGQLVEDRRGQGSPIADGVENLDPFTGQKE